MADKPPQGSPGNEGPEPVPGGSLRSPVTVPGWGLALLLASAIVTGVFIIYLARGSGPLHHAGHLSGSNGTLTSSAGAPATSPTVTSAPDPSGSRPPSATPGAIPMDAACRWAYPGQASGQVSGSDLSIQCLGAGGQVLGGFGDSHSLNAWCADPSHTGGASLPSPQLVNHVWVCAGSAAPQPTQTSTRAGSSPSASRGAAGGAPVPIPMDAACRWAYPGQASGQVSGSDLSIQCLGAGGQVLGGFGDSHSLNAWCADPSHTGGASLPSPQLVNHVWVCAGSAAPQPTQTSTRAGSSPSASRGAAGGAPVPIPMDAACRWAYPGQASGQVSGSDLSIQCLGAGGQVLGGFGDSHSLNAWCADPSHTGGASLPSPQLVNHVWVCAP